MTKTYLSPLRYPGSKRRLVPYLKAVLEQNERVPALFVEPFAGGASVAIQLLGSGDVSRIGLADKDPLIAALWKTIFFDSEWLLSKVNVIDITVEKWREMKRIQADASSSRREQALACLFLNRTSFSGILNESAGPIGGVAQRSKYRIGCRFPRKTLATRISRLAELSGRVAFIWNYTWKQTLAHIRRMQARGSLTEDVFYYLDPPFFEKADRLYSHYFQNGEHRELRDAILKQSHPWVLSYDACAAAFEHYRDQKGLSLAVVELLYNTPHNGNYGTARELILSNLGRLPVDVELWRRGERKGVVRRVV